MIVVYFFIIMFVNYLFFFVIGLCMILLESELKIGFVKNC